jgi:hypothetical protein
MGKGKKMKSKDEKSADREKSITTTKFSKRLLGRTKKSSSGRKG